MSDSRSVLLLAAEEGDVKLLRETLHRGVDVNTPCHVSHRRALVVAAAAGHSRCCEYLVMQGADVDLVDERTGTTALHEATSRGHLGCVAALLKVPSREADINIRSSTAKTAFALACQHGQAECAVLLVLAGCDTGPANMNHFRDLATFMDKDAAWLRTKKVLALLDLLERHERPQWPEALGREWHTVLARFGDGGGAGRTRSRPPPSENSDRTPASRSRPPPSENLDRTPTSGISAPLPSSAAPRAAQTTASSASDRTPRTEIVRMRAGDKLGVQRSAVSFRFSWTCAPRMSLCAAVIRLDGTAPPRTVVGAPVEYHRHHIVDTNNVGSKCRFQSDSIRIETVDETVCSFAFALLAVDDEDTLESLQQVCLHAYYQDGSESTYEFAQYELDHEALSAGSVLVAELSCHERTQTSHLTVGTTSGAAWDLGCAEAALSAGWSRKVAVAAANRTISSWPEDQREGAAASFTTKEPDAKWFIHAIGQQYDAASVLQLMACLEHRDPDTPAGLSYSASPSSPATRTSSQAIYQSPPAPEPSSRVNASIPQATLSTSVEEHPGASFFEASMPSPSKEDISLGTSLRLDPVLVQLLRVLHENDLAYLELAVKHNKKNSLTLAEAVVYAILQSREWQDTQCDRAKEILQQQLEQQITLRSTSSNGRAARTDSAGSVLSEVAVMRTKSQLNDELSSPVASVHLRPMDGKLQDDGVPAWAALESKRGRSDGGTRTGQAPISTAGSALSHRQPTWTYSDDEDTAPPPSPRTRSSAKTVGGLEQARAELQAERLALAQDKARLETERQAALEQREAAGREAALAELETERLALAQQRATLQLERRREAETAALVAERQTLAQERASVEAERQSAQLGLSTAQARAKSSHAESESVRNLHVVRHEVGRARENSELDAMRAGGGTATTGRATRTASTPSGGGSTYSALRTSSRASPAPIPRTASLSSAHALGSRPLGAYRGVSPGGVSALGSRYTPPPKTGYTYRPISEALEDFRAGSDAYSGFLQRSNELKGKRGGSVYNETIDHLTTQLSHSPVADPL